MSQETTPECAACRLARETGAGDALRRAVSAGPMPCTTLTNMSDATVIGYSINDGPWVDLRHPSSPQTINTIFGPSYLATAVDMEGK